MRPQDHYQAGQLTEAVAAATAEVKANPTDMNKRGFLAELLCFQGNVERADLQLDVMAKQDLGSAVGVALFRQLLRGEQARQQLYGEGRLPEFLSQPPAHVQSRLEALVAWRAGDAAGAVALLEAAEEARPRIGGECDGKAFDDLRDLDDVSAGVFEVITSSGKFFWVPVETVSRIEFRPPQRPRDLVWRRAEMTVEDGPDGEVFLPALYVAPASEQVDDALRLGRASDWRGGEGEPVRGVGQRTFLIGDEAVPMMQLGTLAPRIE